MKSQFRKGFNQSVKGQLFHTKVVKIGNQKVVIRHRVEDNKK